MLYLLDDDRDFKRKTAANHASSINALMNVAVRQGLVPTNPLDLKFAVGDSESREPWTEQEMRVLHGQAITGDQPLDVDATDANLLVSMLLWSGARISEIAGLRVEGNSVKFLERVGGVKTVKPCCVLVFGRSNTWNAEQAEAYRIMNAGFHNLTVLTYDHVLTRAKRIVGTDA